MDLTSVTGFVAKALPWIGAAASGNVPALISLAANEVGKITGAKVDPTADAIHTAIATATPEQLLELKKADDEIRLKMSQLGFQSVKDLRELDVRAEEIEAGDRDSARRLQMNTRSIIPAMLALVITIGFFGVLIGLMAGVLKTTTNPETLLLLGALSAAWGALVQFYYGSSVQSHMQTRIMGQTNGKGH